MKAMEHIDILNRIVEAEHKAQGIAGDAKKKRDNLPADLREESARMRESYMKRADKRLESVKEQEELAAVERIAELEDTLEKDIQDFKRLVEEKHDEWVAKLFDTVISV